MKDCILYKILAPIMKVFVKLFLTPKVIGGENIKPDGRLILAGNHTSIMDIPLLISSTKRQIHFLAKKELLAGPGKILFGNMGVIPVDRKNKDHFALKSAEEYLKSELLVGIFPEGTTEKEGHMLPFKMGALKMAKDTNSPIVPFVITGKYRLFSRSLTITFLPSFYITGDLEEERDRLYKIIATERNKYL